MDDDLKILYEDNHLIVVYKPAGVLVQPAVKGGESLIEQTKAYLKKKYNKPGNVFLGLVHRIDRPVSGIVLFAKTSKGASRISEQFREHQIKKTYSALVIGKLEPSKGILRHSLMKDEDRKIAKISEEGKESELYYETIKSSGSLSLLKIQPITGRFHQIRAQLAHAGHPIVGDTKYLPAGRQAANRQVAHLKDGSIALCATELEFETATTGEMKKITVNYPESWKEFI